MSEKKNVIEIPVPEGYEQCLPMEATHVLLGRANVYLIDKNNYKELATGKRFPPDKVFGKITAYLRKVPKPEPFRVVLEDCAIMQATVSKDGQCSVKFIVVGNGRVDTDFTGKNYRVTIEEVLLNE